MGANTKFGAKEVMDVILFDMESGRPVIFFDTLKTSDIEVTSEKVYAQGGRGNAKLITWEINKEGKLTLEDALLSPKSLELITGMASVTGVRAIDIRQDTVYENGVSKGDLFPLSVGSTGKIELAFTPIEAVADILVYEASDDCGTPIDMGEAQLSGKTLTLPTSLAGKKVVVYYTYQTKEDTQTYTVAADKFSGTYRLVGDTVIRNAETGKDESFQVRIPNLKFSSALNLSLSADGDPSSTTFECDIMKASDSTTMIELVKY